MADTWNRKKGARASACTECGSDDLAAGRRKCKACLARMESERRTRVYERDSSLECAEVGCVDLRYSMPSQVSSYCEWHHKLIRKKIRLKADYNLTLDQYDALLFRANYSCQVCGGTKKLCVDHDHRCCPGSRSCGECIRGIVCNDHNLMLGYGQDDPAALRAGAEYLETHDRLNAR